MLHAPALSGTLAIRDSHKFIDNFLEPGIKNTASMWRERRDVKRLMSRMTVCIKYENYRCVQF
jgi:hypothetical protein